MPRINLLPIKAAQRQVSARNEMFAMVAVVVGVFAILFLYNSSRESELDEMRAKIRTVDSQIGKLGEEVKKVQELQKKEAKVKDKLKVITRLVGNRSGSVRMLHEIAVIMTSEAKRVWLTKLAVNDAGKLTMAGGAIDHEDISEFQLALERRSMFTKVHLSKVSTTNSKDAGPYLQWQMECVMRFDS